MRYQTDREMFTQEDSQLPSASEALEFLSKHPGIEYVDLLIIDMNGIVRGKRIEKNKLAAAYDHGIGMPLSIFGMDITGTSVEETGLGIEIGESDAFCYPVGGTLSMQPWQQRPIAQVLLQMYEDETTPFFADPRMVLNRIVRKLKEKGLTAVSAFEIEFYLVDGRAPGKVPMPPVSPVTGKRPATTQVYSLDDLDHYADLLTDIIDGARAQGLPADAIVAESAPGQFEINLNHVGDPQASCDHAMLLKRVIKQTAHVHQLDSTFMAKPYADQAGNGMHLHISLIDEDGRNIFQPEVEGELTNTIRYALGGMLKLLPEYMAILCPNINSYRRFGPDFYVPCSPSWGIENRTTALRIPIDTPEATRIEHRIAGTDANPYLMMSALLASILYGIENKIEPPAPTVGSAYDKEDELTLPTNLRDALRELDSSEVMRHYLGTDFVDVFVTCKQKELEQFERHITDLEYDWYLHAF
ncbi:glutamine synthetase family protein [Enterovibrio paralichthyis]|uniref:glutamine synthetase family protein n=1 Tax=Enterovibrio paralichthyis TaxID=2853805 RepID=UPI001C44B0AF|nr:glutamine synthetase family protein [Enterovibrio paralichthyis]MBV7299505.1 glutamine synthetase family protein [Enterovibrio paralichthyis]